MTLAETEVTRHLGGCDSCTIWLTEAQRITRTVRVQAVAVPDLTAAILAAVQAQGVDVPRRRFAGVLSAGPVRSGLRWVLGFLAVIQLMLAVPTLLGDVGHEAHAGREVAALEIALAVGLLLSACYPDHARFFAPVVITLVFCFASASALDIMDGAVSLSRVARHMLVVVQALAVWSLARTPTVRAVTA